MRILATNDDGIDAPGLHALAEAMSEFGQVCVVAPDRERSAAGHSLTLHRPLRIHRRGERAWAVDGTPTDCVNLAVKEILKHDPPRIVVSGINLGANLGDDITYSGTFCAALEGALLGIPSMAISLVLQNDAAPNFPPAASCAKTIVREILRRGLSPDVVLNVNVPNLNGEERVEGIEITRLGKRRYEDAIAEKLDPRGKKYYWIGGEALGFEDLPGSDCHAVLKRHASVTPVRLDLTHDRFLSTLKEWDL